MRFCFKKLWGPDDSTDGIYVKCLYDDENESWTLIEPDEDDEDDKIDDSKTSSESENMIPFNDIAEIGFSGDSITFLYVFDSNGNKVSVNPPTDPSDISRIKQYVLDNLCPKK